MPFCELAASALDYAEGLSLGYVWTRKNRTSTGGKLSSYLAGSSSCILSQTLHQVGEPLGGWFPTLLFERPLRMRNGVRSRGAVEGSGHSVRTSFVIPFRLVADDVQEVRAWRSALSLVGDTPLEN